MTVHKQTQETLRQHFLQTTYFDAIIIVYVQEEQALISLVRYRKVYIEEQQSQAQVATMPCRGGDGGQVRRRLMDSNGAVDSHQSGPDRTFFWSLVLEIKHVVRDQRTGKRRSETSLSFMLVLLVNGGRMHVRDGDVRMELPLAFSQFHQISSDVPTMFFEWRNGIQIVAHQFPFVHRCQLFVYP